MKYLLLVSIMLFNFGKATAGDLNNLSIIDLNSSNSSSINFNDFLWQKRIVIVFADNPEDPNFVSQIKLLRTRPIQLLERDVIIFIDTNPTPANLIRSKLRPKGFSFILIAKDGKISLRKSRPWNIREISRSIDKMPLRKQEIKLLYKN
jgi:hypothetical protein